ncbi:hypothetical protein ILYODFUR_002116 [Ilyodon furcidens]|uniref:Uncharacterized protein n=1 Tax=Ilyodon furcidens TaxID=33524 RepID=A0ABV0SUH4_9TELE
MLQAEQEGFTRGLLTNNETLQLPDPDPDPGRHRERSGVTHQANAAPMWSSQDVQMTFPSQTLEKCGNCSQHQWKPDRSAWKQRAATVNPEPANSAHPSTLSCFQSVKM